MLKRYERYGFVIVIALLFFTDVFNVTVLRLASILMYYPSLFMGIISDAYVTLN
jgi:hypothetical protein